MSQKALADVIGVTPQTLSAWLSEKGRKKEDEKDSEKGKEDETEKEKKKQAERYPNTEYLFAMADELKISVDRLIGRQVPGTEHLQLDREDLHRKANALDRILPGGFDDGVRPATKKMPKPASKTTGETASKNKEPEPAPEAEKPEGENKKPPKS